MSTEKSFESWAIVEVMGHKRMAGFVSEQTVAGTAFVRVDVPEFFGTGDRGEAGQHYPAFTKLLGPSSIYAITPCTEETARAFATKLQERAFTKYEAPRLAALPNPYKGDVLDGGTMGYDIGSADETISNHDDDEEYPT